MSVKFSTKEIVFVTTFIVATILFLLRSAWKEISNHIRIFYVVKLTSFLKLLYKK